MPELYGEYEGDAESQYVGCLNCGDAVDLFEPHPMFRDESVSEVGDVTARTYHFCSDGCLQTWKKKREYGE
ncbi:hypothetical protein NGM10_17030 (plasmid) [Halorussus salilacus]|uniref:DUF7576 family protein n=1 Tax=Halorussus salilacus TaxID=2953750 RepID=UPI00209D3526|nr:hypothetical protein [Halorussus salilacus]USZ69799.1 hypothetical protein NGM10_17030 [Halorussus salilacus]